MARRGSFCFETLERRLCLTSVGWDGPGQDAASVTYYIGVVPSDVDETEFRDTIASAFAVWAQVIELNFEETAFRRQRDSIDINFREIDGPGGTLAKAYFPDDVNPGRTAGDIVFDSEENWEFGNSRRTAATDLMLVAVHEIGHSLGLEHSADRNAVMFESTHPNAEFTGLTQADTDAILSLYLQREAPVRGDFSADSLVDASDIDVLSQAIHSGDVDERFDLNDDGIVDIMDQDVLIEDILGTVYGDANLDGRFNANDLVTLLQHDRFENSDSRKATWATGDWNGDSRFDRFDLILALSRDGFTIVAV